MEHCWGEYHSYYLNAYRLLAPFFCRKVPMAAAVTQSGGSWEERNAPIRTEISLKLQSNAVGIRSPRR
jgi:hypothetical protein